LESLSIAEGRRKRLKNTEGCKKRPRAVSRGKKRRGIQYVLISKRGTKESKRVPTEVKR